MVIGQLEEQRLRAKQNVPQFVKACLKEQAAAEGTSNAAKGKQKKKQQQSSEAAE